MPVNAPSPRQKGSQFPHLYTTVLQKERGQISSFHHPPPPSRSPFCRKAIFTSKKSDVLQVHAARQSHGGQFLIICQRCKRTKSRCLVFVHERLPKTGNWAPRRAGYKFHIVTRAPGESDWWHRETWVGLGNPNITISGQRRSWEGNLRLPLNHGLGSQVRGQKIRSNSVESRQQSPLF